MLLLALGCGLLPPGVDPETRAAAIAPGTPDEPVPEDPARAALERFLPERADDPVFRELVDRALRSSRGRKIAQRGAETVPELSAIREIVLDRGMPELFVGIPYWESYLDDDAISRSCAGGAWQLMPATAVELGLRVGACATVETDHACDLLCGIDERRDIAAATKAAIELLARSWEAQDVAASRDRAGLVVLAYNVGLGAARVAAADGEAWDALTPVATGYVPGVVAAAALSTCGAATRPTSRFAELERTGLCRSLAAAELLPGSEVVAWQVEDLE